MWSLIFRYDSPPARRETATFNALLERNEDLISTGLVLQELLQGFSGPKQKEAIIRAFDNVPLLVPEKKDYVNAAELRNLCRRNGVQVGTIDALIAALCIDSGSSLLTADHDFILIAEHTSLHLL